MYYELQVHVLFMKNNVNQTNQENTDKLIHLSTDIKTLKQLTQQQIK